MPLLVMNDGIKTTIKLNATTTHWTNGCVWEAPFAILELNQIVIVVAFL